ncbi:hypothetical protein AQI94_31850 [Streptomyces pseudovenezuelae]|uniref:UspA domain-containing protein n=1 Tax=Streptomyces pseudovenezuelae TaxID=67350 RepID=A0A101N0N2_9ACTN|nr:hypothetical protein AQI94_31850 [Streptomyces pseudovenezuelae]
MVAGVLMKLTALRSHMRSRALDEGGDEGALKAVGLTAREAEDLHRLLAVAQYQDRYVVPAAHKEDAAALSALENRCTPRNRAIVTRGTRRPSLTRFLRDAVAEHPGARYHRGVPAHTVLGHRSAAADLVVVSPRRRSGHFGFGLQLGRVSHILLHHAQCPVAVVPRYM